MNFEEWQQKYSGPYMELTTIEERYLVLKNKPWVFCTEMLETSPMLFKLKVAESYVQELADIIYNGYPEDASVSSITRPMGPSIR